MPAFNVFMAAHNLIFSIKITGFALFNFVFIVGGIVKFCLIEDKQDGKANTIEFVVGGGVLGLISWYLSSWHDKHPDRGIWFFETDFGSRYISPAFQSLCNCGTFKPAVPYILRFITFFMMIFPPCVATILLHQYSNLASIPFFIVVGLTQMLSVALSYTAGYVFFNFTYLHHFLAAQKNGPGSSFIALLVDISAFILALRLSLQLGIGKSKENMPSTNHHYSGPWLLIIFAGVSAVHLVASIPHLFTFIKRRISS